MRTGALSARGPALVQRTAPSKTMASRKRPSIATMTTTRTTSTSTSSPPPSSSTRAASLNNENFEPSNENRKLRGSRARSIGGFPASAAGSSAGGAAADDGKRSSTLLSKLKNVFGGEKLDRERLKKLGSGAVASYGFISNVTYGGGMAVSWVGFVKKYAVSPLASGQWPKFLAFYSAFWMAQNFVRPLRFSAALALAPAFDKFIDFLSTKLKITRPRAFGVYLFILGTVTCTLVFGGIFLACGPAAYAR